MATINLGAIKFNWKGAYNNGTTYAVDDVVSSGGNSYVCIQASTGNAVGNATAYWNIMSAKGTNGSAGAEGGSTTLTTQGDLLYRDGSGLQRLAKGTASQELRMNSSANAPELTFNACPAVPIAIPSKAPAFVLNAISLFARPKVSPAEPLEPLVPAKLIIFQ